MTDVFRPNKAVSNNTALCIVLVQISFGFAFWAFYPSELIPKPYEVMTSWVKMIRSDGMIYELSVSFLVNLEALAISTVISLGLACLTVLPVVRPLVSMVSKARFFSMTGFVVIFTVMFGTGHWLKVSLLVFGMTVFFVTSMASVVAEIPREEYDHARTLRMSGWRTVWEVVILGRADYAIESFRQNAAISWMMLTMVEGLSRSEGGIGVMMLDQNKHFHLSNLFALQLTIFAVGILQDFAIVAFKRIVCPYSELVLERQ